MSTAAIPEGLYALIDDGVCPRRPLVQKAAGALEGGAKLLQLRMKRTAGKEAVAVAREVVALCLEAGAVCLINDRVDWALLSGAHGVHLGQEDLPVEEARRLLGTKAIIGATVRDLEGARRAAGAGADYVGLGPIFRTGTKEVPHAELGLDGLREVASKSPLPVVAIAGIGLGNIASVAEAGAHGAAVAQDLLTAPDIARQARALADHFARGRKARTIRAEK